MSEKWIARKRKQKIRIRKQNNKKQKQGYWISDQGIQMQKCDYEAWGSCSYPCIGDC
jgi:hypothetical protein